MSKIMWAAQIRLDRFKQIMKMQLSWWDCFIILGGAREGEYDQSALNKILKSTSFF